MSQQTAFLHIVWLFLHTRDVITAQTHSIDIWTNPQVKPFGAVQSFTLQIETAILDRVEFNTHWSFHGRRCLRPSLSFILENIADPSSQSIKISLNRGIFIQNLTSCASGSDQHACGEYNTCLSGYELDIDTVSSLEIIIEKSAMTAPGTAPCSNPARSINANVTVNCGRKTALEYDATSTIDLSNYSALNPPATSYQTYEKRIETKVGSSVWAFYDASFFFIGHACYNPVLSVQMQDIDFEATHEYVELYTPDLVTGNVTCCSGVVDDNCAHFFQCLDGYALSPTNIYAPFHQVALALLKSNTVQSLYCGAAVNATIILQCQLNRYAETRVINMSTQQQNHSHVYVLPLVRSTAFSNNDIHFEVKLQFVDGVCVRPRMQWLRFKNTQLTDNDYLQIYSALNASDLWHPSSMLARCDASSATSNTLNTDSSELEHSSCDDWYLCMNDTEMMALDDDTHSYPPLNEIHVGVLKSKNIRSLLCGYTVNVEVAIACDGALPDADIESTMAVEFGSSTLSTEIDESVKKDTSFLPFEVDIYVILTAVMLFVFGICIAVCCMTMCMFWVRRKRNNQLDNGEKRDVEIVHYKSLKSVDIDTGHESHDEKKKANEEDSNMDARDSHRDDQLLQIEGETLQYMVGGEVPKTDDDESSTELMFINENQEDSSELDEHLATTKGDTITCKGDALPKRMDNNLYQVRTCQECGLGKLGVVDLNGDGLFYCGDCWYQYDNGM